MEGYAAEIRYSGVPSRRGDTRLPVFTHGVEGVEGVAKQLKPATDKPWFL
jgi:hypothetical protein